MAAPYGNSAVYRGAQRRANMIQNRDTANQQEDPLKQSIMGTPLEEDQPSPQLPTNEGGSQFTLKPYSDNGGFKKPQMRPANGPSGLGQQQQRGDLFNRGGAMSGGGSNPLLDSINRSPVETGQSGGDIGRIVDQARRAYGSPGSSVQNGVNGATVDPESSTSGQGIEEILKLLGVGSGQSTLGAGQPEQGTGQSLDSSQWNTEGWATPQYLGKAAGGAMAGWDQTNWDDQNMQTPKYVVGRILSNYTPSIDGLGAAMEEIQQAYPGAEFDGKDKVIIPGLGTIDVLVNAGGDNMSWAWQDQTNGPQDSPLAQSITQGATSPASSLLGGLDPSLFNDPAWRQLLESLGINLNGL